MTGNIHDAKQRIDALESALAYFDADKECETENGTVEALEEQLHDAQLKVLNMQLARDKCRMDLEKHIASQRGDDEFSFDLKDCLYGHVDDREDIINQLQSLKDEHAALAEAYELNGTLEGIE